MIQSLRQIKNRIRSIDNVKKVTYAMEMISIAKLRPIQSQLANFKQYLSKTQSLLNNLLACRKGITNPFVEEREGKQKIALCLITSDTGLCGSYNNNIIRVAENFINKYGREKIELIAAGKKGLNYFKRRGVNIANSFIELHGRYSEVLGKNILGTLTGIFLSKKVNEVYIAYTHFESAARHIPRIEKFLNISSTGTSEIEYIFEPDINTIIEELIPSYLSNKMKLILLEAFGCEHSSRTIAMGESTENAKELLEKMIVLRNKVRQANITKDLLEISSAAEVLR
jgi:F-type H+-transporting ATPase subunit gamma